MALQLGFRDPSLDHLVKGSEVEGSIDFRLAFRLCQCMVAPEGNDLILELVAELPRCLLLTNDIFTIEIRLFPTELVIPSSALSYQGAFEGASLHAVVVVEL